MKKIKFVKIGGHKVKVKFYPTCEMQGNMGCFWIEHNIIQVCQDFPSSQQEVTFLHEIIHHCLSNLGYKYDKDDDSSTIHSEKTVEGLAQALYQVFVDNPGLEFGKTYKM